MTPQESKLLQDFLTQMVDAGSVPKDRDADGLIQQAARAQPDALYLVVQRSLIQQQALDAAQRRISDLERAAQAGSDPARSSFLGAGNAWGRSSGASRNAQDQGLGREAASVFGSRGPAPAAAGRGSALTQTQGGGAAAGAGGSRAGGFLGQAAAMAAGVAGGAFLFHGIGSLLGHGSEATDGSLSPGGLEPVAENDTSNSEYANDANDAGASGNWDANDNGGASGQWDDQGGSADYDAGSDFGGDDFGGGDSDFA